MDFIIFLAIFFAGLMLCQFFLPIESATHKIAAIENVVICHQKSNTMNLPILWKIKSKLCCNQSEYTLHHDATFLHHVFPF